MSISGCLSRPVTYHNVNLFIGVLLQLTVSHPRFSGCPLLFRVCCKKHKLMQLCQIPTVHVSSYSRFFTSCFCASATIRTVLQVFAMCACMHVWSYINSFLTQYHITACGSFTACTTSVLLRTVMSWLGFEVKRLEVKVTARSYILKWALALGGMYSRRRWNAWTYYDQLYHCYLLPHPHDSGDVFQVMGSKVKFTDVIFRKWTLPVPIALCINWQFAVERPFSFVIICRF